MKEMTRMKETTRMKEITRMRTMRMRYQQVKPTVFFVFTMEHLHYVF
jgi:hypothetical protein